jgi:hypothetical protein
MYLCDLNKPAENDVPVMPRIFVSGFKLVYLRIRAVYNHNYRSSPRYTRHD